jgi:hypothetical protein
MPLAAASPRVLAAATEIISAIEVAASRHDAPELPPFNEVTWTRYPQHTGQITAHHDPVEYRGVIAIFTLEGSADFRVFDKASDSWRASPTAPGDLVILRSRWPTSDAACPTHAADPPATSGRMIMTLRSNSRGAGGGYSLD